jgi:2-(3-amino-3-carboxypropyl)histidine synthase
MAYDLELDKVVQGIKENNAKLVCLQLPDGLKPQANEIETAITKQTDAKVLIWLGSCFGACDVPLGLANLGIDLMFSWGHNKFKKETW